MSTIGYQHVSSTPTCTCAQLRAFHQLALPWITLQTLPDFDDTNATALLESALGRIHTGRTFLEEEQRKIWTWNERLTRSIWRAPFIPSPNLIIETTPNQSTHLHRALDKKAGDNEMAPSAPQNDSS